MEEHQELKQWVREHEVTWEISPWQEMVEHAPASVGLELRLFARHEEGTHPSPGCGHCIVLYEKLREIALAVCPGEERASRYDIDPFDSSFHLRSERHWTPEVQLAIHIIHREQYLSPLDDCEKRCADEIQHGLRLLGVQPKVWSEIGAKA